MPEDPTGGAAPAAASGLRGTLTRKVGPLPLWAWAVAAGVAVLGFRVYSGRTDAPRSAQTVARAPAVASQSGPASSSEPPTVKAPAEPKGPPISNRRRTPNAPVPGPNVPGDMVGGPWMPSGDLIDGVRLPTAPTTPTVPRAPIAPPPAPVTYATNTLASVVGAPSQVFKSVAAVPIAFNAHEEKPIAGVPPISAPAQSGLDIARAAFARAGVASGTEFNYQGRTYTT